MRREEMHELEREKKKSDIKRNQKCFGYKRKKRFGFKRNKKCFGYDRRKEETFRI